MSFAIATAWSNAASALSRRGFFFRPFSLKPTEEVSHSGFHHIETVEQEGAVGRAVCRVRRILRSFDHPLLPDQSAFVLYAFSRPHKRH